MSYHSGNRLMQVYMFESGLWIFMLESVLALAALALIVWWTLPRRKRPTETGEDNERQSLVARISQIQPPASSTRCPPLRGNCARLRGCAGADTLRSSRS